MDWLRRRGRTGGNTPSVSVDPSLRRTAFVPSVAPGPFGEGSGFGGRPYLAHGMSHPTCPQCDRPMPLIAQIDLAAQPAPVIRGDGLLQLFYCTREVDDNGCDVMLEAWEPFSEGHVTRLVSAGPGGSVPEADTPFEPVRITAWTAADDYPNWQELEELGVGSLAHGDDHPTLEGEKLGGWPAWVQGVEYPSCPRCGARMELVLQVDSRKTIDTMWGDVGIGHVTQCPNDPDVLTFAWACS